MDNIEKVYDYLKSYMEEKGYPPTIKQIASDLNLKEHEVQGAFEHLKESGRIKVTDIPGNTTIEFVE